MTEPVIEILIPTYNRAEFITENLTRISRQIRKDQLSEIISISISDNASSDNTEDSVKNFIANNPKISLSYTRNDENIGLEPNALKLLEYARAPYVLWLGDDDFLAEGYIKYGLDKIGSIDNLGCIIPGLTALYSDGSQVSGRNEKFEEKYLEAGYDSVYECSHMGHSMSGLVCRREKLFENYTSNSQFRNPYLFLYFVADRLFHYDSVFAPSFKTQINAYNQKDWGYNEVGLLDEIFKCYYPFQDVVSPSKISDLLIRFSVLHSYRYGFKPLKPLKLFKQYLYLTRSTPDLPGFKRKLAIHLFKDYLLSFTR